MKQVFAFLLGIAFGITIFLPANPVKAAEGMKISPLKIEELVLPGETIRKKIKIQNLSDSQKEIYGFIRDFKADGEGGKAILITPGSEEGSFLSEWVEIESGPIIFGPNQEREIDITVKVPENAGPGGYYGAVAFGSQAPTVRPEGEEKGAAVAVSQQAAVLLIFQVTGKVFEDAIIRDFKTDKHFYNNPKVSFSARIENKGNVHIKPLGTIEVKNMFGKEVSKLRLNESGGNVLPEGIRKFNENWEETFGFGRYEALLAISYGTSPEYGGEGKKTLVSTTYFWVLPWKIVAPIGGGIIVLIILLSLFLRFYKRAAIKKAVGHHYSSNQNNNVNVLKILAYLIIIVIILMIIYFIFLS